MLAHSLTVYESATNELHNTEKKKKSLFRLSGRMRNRERGIKARGSWGELGRPRFFNFSVISLFPRFLAVSRLKGPLRRREVADQVRFLACAKFTPVSTWFPYSVVLLVISQRRI